MKMEMHLCLKCAELMEDGFSMKSIGNIVDFKCEKCKKKTPVGKKYEVTTKEESE